MRIEQPTLFEIHKLNEVITKKYDKHNDIFDTIKNELETSYFSKDPAALNKVLEHLKISVAPEYIRQYLSPIAGETSDYRNLLSEAWCLSYDLHPKIQFERGEHVIVSGSKKATVKFIEGDMIYALSHRENASNEVGYHRSFLKKISLDD